MHHLEIDQAAYRYSVDNNYLYVSRQNYTGSAVRINNLIPLIFNSLLCTCTCSPIVVQDGSTCRQTLTETM